MDLRALVERWNEGDAEAFDQIIELVYDDLRSIAHRHLSTERTGHTLGTTALVNEAYVVMAERTGIRWQGRARFFALLSRVMRHVLIDHARRRGAAKRGGGEVLVALDEAQTGGVARRFELLYLADVLERLEERDDQLARIVECRFFGGMPATEIATALGISSRTVERGWMKARSYLLAALSDAGAGSTDQGGSGMAPEGSGDPTA